MISQRMLDEAKPFLLRSMCELGVEAVSGKPVVGPDLDLFTRLVRDEGKEVCPHVHKLLFPGTDKAVWGYARRMAQQLNRRVQIVFTSSTPIIPDASWTIPLPVREIPKPAPLPPTATGGDDEGDAEIEEKPVKPRVRVRNIPLANIIGDPALEEESLNSVLREIDAIRQRLVRTKDVPKMRPLIRKIREALLGMAAWLDEETA